MKILVKKIMFVNVGSVRYYYIWKYEYVLLSWVENKRLKCYICFFNGFEMFLII